MTPKELGRLFSTFAQSAFRLDTLARYTVPEEADRLRLFMEGVPNPGPDDANVPGRASFAGAPAPAEACSGSISSVGR